jgi:serine protease AprX
MNTSRSQKRILPILGILLLISLLVTPVGAAPLSEDFTSKVSTEVMQATTNGESTSFIVFLQDQADVSAAYTMQDQDARGWYVYNTLTEKAAQTQAPIINELQADGVSYTSFWAANMIVVEGDRSVVEEMAARPDVKVIESNEVIDGVEGEDAPESLDDGTATNAVESGVTQTTAPQLWALGFKGQNIVVGNQDTGMRWTQAAIRTHYRGWGGSVADSNHNYNWHDSIHAQITSSDGGTASPANNPCGRNITAPCDDQGHGTHTTGTTVGDDAGAGIGTGTNQVGVAPAAQWIGCRNMDSGNGRASTYTECFQFFIAPTDLNGQNADPTRRPHVMNNSWGCPLSGELCARTVLQTITANTQAAGIMVVASAGNDGSACSTVLDPPGIYDAAFSVGSLTSANALSNFSSRGPVTSDGSGRMKPDISARGQSVRSSYYSSDTSYASMSGTSMASPHVVGTVALLWSARPNLVRDIPRTKWLLTRSANPAVTVPNNSTGCGGIASVPNNHFGWGRVDVLAAYNLEPSLYQTITFGSLPNKTYGDADFSVSATASSGLAVSFSASGNCTVTGSTVQITGAGSCTITASQPGLDSYSIAASAAKPWYAAPNISQTFSIAKATPTLTWNKPTDIVLGTALGNGQLNATASVPGTFVYTPPAGTVLPVGYAQNLHVDFTPTDTANYNNVSADVAINVVYKFSGFQQPVDNLPLYNTANAGQAIPLKWRITDVYGNPVTNLPGISIIAVSLSCQLGTTSDQIEEYAPGSSGFRNLGNGYYQFNWATPKAYAKSCKTLKLDLGEGPGMERTAAFQFTR